MLDFNKRFRPNPVFDENQYQPPDRLKKSLDIITESFTNSRMRNLELMDSDEGRLYGFITHYESGNFCWIQPTRTLDRATEIEYDRYIKRINRDFREGKLKPLEKIQVGMDVVAQYEVDRHWYRAKVVEVPDDPHLYYFGNWLVLFVDYGNFQRTNKDHMAHIIQDPDCDHFHAPMQAVCCRLYNIVPRLPQNRAQIDKKLSKYVDKYSSRFLEIVVRNKRLDYIVDCDLFLCKVGVVNEARFYKKHIGQSLIDKGIATFADEKAAYAIIPPHIIVKSPKIECVTLDEDEEEDVKRKIKVELDVKFKPPGDFKVKLEPGVKIEGGDIKPKLENIIKIETKPKFEFRPFG